ncbi:phosphotransferase [Deinococcus sp. SDU3-2]|uniref:Phosphotransferase n=2 Tax=Deinococcus terrestris TaxID=2651870 RepID=A0A7X1NVS5_9DEIO|nr:phosphotransferase [Deinococcus terrestris]
MVGCGRLQTCQGGAMSIPAAPFPAAYSTLSAQALAAWVEARYSCTGPVTCTLLRRGLNDTYRVTGLAGRDRAALRVYRSGWRSPGEVEWELGFLRHLAGAGCAVSGPLPQPGGACWEVLEAAEGPRVAALFGWVEGRWLEAVPEDAAAYGKAAARLHTAADPFRAEGRFALDLDHLLTQPLAVIRPLLAESPEVWQELEAAAHRTHAALTALAPRLEWGPCHGDLHEGNARLEADGTVRLFDFDCGGPGWRAYDLAVYGWSLFSNSGQTPEAAEEAWRAFLAAYQSLRPLGAADLQALPLFVTARAIWFMGLNAGRAHEYGTEVPDLGFFQYGLKFIRDWEAWPEA